MARRYLPIDHCGSFGDFHCLFVNLYTTQRLQKESTFLSSPLETIRVIEFYNHLLELERLKEYMRLSWRSTEIHFQVANDDS
jgi:hypothetical protein